MAELRTSPQQALSVWGDAGVSLNVDPNARLVMNTILWHDGGHLFGLVVVLVLGRCDMLMLARHSGLMPPPPLPHLSVDVGSVLLKEAYKVLVLQQAALLDDLHVGLGPPQQVDLLQHKLTNLATAGQAWLEHSTTTSTTTSNQQQLG
jgi:hypothetical protein